MSNTTEMMPGPLLSREDNLGQSWNESCWESGQLPWLVKSTRYLKLDVYFTDSRCILCSGSSVYRCTTLHFSCLFF